MHRFCLYEADLAIRGPVELYFLRFLHFLFEDRLLQVFEIENGQLGYAVGEPDEVLWKGVKNAFKWAVTSSRTQAIMRLSLLGER